MKAAHWDFTFVAADGWRQCSEVVVTAPSPPPHSIMGILCNWGRCQSHTETKCGGGESEWLMVVELAEEGK